MTYLEGVDLSRYQPPASTNWGMMQARAGITFAFIQADSAFQQHVDNCRAESSVLPIPYSFVLLTRPIDAQIDALYDMVTRSGLGPTVALDCEHDPTSVGLKERIAMYEEAANMVEARFGAKPIIYTYPYYNTGLWPEEFSDLPLWISHPSAEPDMSIKLLPKTWNGWAFWQYTDDKTVVQYVPGYPGHALRDRFNGTLDNLKTMLWAGDHWDAPVCS